MSSTTPVHGFAGFTSLCEELHYRYQQYLARDRMEFSTSNENEKQYQKIIRKCTTAANYGQSSLKFGKNKISKTNITRLMEEGNFIVGQNDEGNGDVVHTIVYWNEVV